MTSPPRFQDQDNKDAQALGNLVPDNLSVEQIKNILFLLPVFGTAAALSFDVGYFYGIDLNLFTLFSLSEHVLFVFEALPLALAFALLIGQVVMMVAVEMDGSDYQPSARIDRFIENHKSSFRSIVRSIRFVVEHFPSARSIGRWLMIIAAVWAWAWFPKGLVGLTILFGMFMAGIVLIVARRLRRSRRAQIALACVVGLFSIFWLGRFIAHNYLAASTPTHFVDTKDGMLEGKIIRSGDKGVLFQNVKENTVLFLKWDDIKRITAPQQSS